GREAMPIDGKGAASRKLVGVGGAHDQGIAAAHLFMEQADRVLLVIVRAEAVRADELGKAVRAVRVGAFDPAHLVENDLGAGFGGLPGGFRASKAAADDMNWFL